MAKINRDKKQREVADLWLDSDRRNSLILGTGFGKSRVAMLIVQSLFNAKNLTKDSKILILVDSEKLRDDNWQEDFEKWDLMWVWELVHAECYQTVYKWKDTEWDFVIADEIDFSLTNEYMKFYINNNVKMLLGLTGYVAPDKTELLKSVAPPLITYSTQQAQADGVLNTTQVVFISFDLSHNKDDFEITYMQGRKKKSFSQSENDAYNYAQDKCDEVLRQIDEIKSDFEYLAGDVVKITALNRLKGRLKGLQSKRKELLYNGIASRQVAKDLIELLLKNPKNKIVTFSMLTDQCDKINEYTFHGKNKKVSKHFIKRLSTGNIRSLGVCKAINRGVNISGLNSLINESYDGSTTQFTQRHGRGTRLSTEEVMNLYIFLPYYHKKVDSPENPNGMTYVRTPTQAVTWARNMLAGFKVIDPIVVHKGVGKDDWTRDDTQLKK